MTDIAEDILRENADLHARIKELEGRVWDWESAEAYYRLERYEKALREADELLGIAYDATEDERFYQGHTTIRQALTPEEEK